MAPLVKAYLKFLCRILMKINKKCLPETKVKKVTPAQVEHTSQDIEYKSKRQI